MDVPAEEESFDPDDEVEQDDESWDDADAWVGLPLLAQDGAEVGTVQNVVTDEDGTMTEIHVEVGGFMGWFTRTVALPAQRVLLEQDGQIVTDLTEDQITDAPSID